MYMESCPLVLDDNPAIAINTLDSTQEVEISVTNPELRKHSNTVLPEEIIYPVYCQHNEK